MTRAVGGFMGPGVQAIDSGGGWVDVTPPSISKNQNDINPGSQYGEQAIVVDPNNPGTVYCGTCYQGIWKSQDYGYSWRRCDVAPWLGQSDAVAYNFSGDGTNGGGRVWSLVIDPANSNLYAASGYGVQAGLIKSTDGGVHWTQMPIAQLLTTDINYCDVDPSTANKLLVSYHTFQGKISLSTDGGSTFTHLTVTGTTTGGQWAFFITSTTWIVLGDEGIYRTTNSGSTWTRVSSTFFDQHGNAQLYKTATAGKFYLGCRANVIRTTDSGTTWTSVLASPNADGYNAIIGDGTNLYTRTANTGVGTSAALPFRTALESADTSWSDDMPTQLWNDGPLKLAIDNKFVYASCWNQGILRRARIS